MNTVDPLGLWDDGGCDPFFGECGGCDSFFGVCDFPCGPLRSCIVPIPVGGLSHGPFHGSGGGRRIGGKWPNGETLGLPTGLNLKPMGLAELIGLSPGTSCDFGVCGTIGNGFEDATALAPAIGILRGNAGVPRSSVGRLSLRHNLCGLRGRQPLSKEREGKQDF